VSLVIPQLELRHIHLWLMDLDLSHGLAERELASLDQNESRRADGFGSASAKIRFVRTRYYVRQFLAHYLSCDVLDIRFEYNLYGKPALYGQGVAEGLQFNVSHSGDLALMGFTLNGEIGVDLESSKPRKNLSAIAAKCLSTSEWAWWSHLDEELKPKRFRCLWSCKESFAKAVGHGLGLGINRISVSECSTRFDALPEGTGQVEDWCLFQTIYKDYSIAVSYRKPSRVIKVFSSKEPLALI